MKTINSKELRTNLKAILERVKDGEEIRVTYRNKPAAVLRQDERVISKPRRGTAPAILMSLERIRMDPEVVLRYQHPGLDFKAAYHQALDEKYGFKA